MKTLMIAIMAVLVGTALFTISPLKTNVSAQQTTEVCPEDRQFVEYQKAAKEIGANYTEYTGPLLLAIGQLYPLEDKVNKLVVFDFANGMSLLVEFYNDCAMHQQPGPTEQVRALIQLAREKHRAEGRN